jgi:hypothetical protein
MRREVKEKEIEHSEHLAWQRVIHMYGLSGRQTATDVASFRDSDLYTHNLDENLDVLFERAHAMAADDGTEVPLRYEDFALSVPRLLAIMKNISDNAPKNGHQLNRKIEVHDILYIFALFENAEVHRISQDMGTVLDQKKSDAKALHSDREASLIRSSISLVKQRREMNLPIHTRIPGEIRSLVHRPNLIVNK